ncbi:MAG: 16S rRNA (cytosine(1402)-N(4))-methyltransferase RsmH [Arcobacteraceae bacterium]
MHIPHIPVLFNEVLETFKSIDQGYIVDCTLGYAGHSEGLLKQNEHIQLICNDQDEEALNFSKNRLKPFEGRVIFNQGNFETVLNDFKEYPVKGILADIGVSSLQLDKQERGFGFESTTLDMRMNQTQTLDASYVVNHYSQEELERVLKEYGEVKEYKKAASLIVKQRPFTSSKELSSYLHSKMHKGKIHPATLVFQGIRIEVNDELGVLERLFDSIELLKPKGCTVAIISFHSLEDRIVKNYFRKWSKSCSCPVGVYRCECGNNNALGKVLTKKPIVPTTQEIKHNPRSRSSKLRIFKFD